MYALLQLLLMQFSSLAGAVDIIFYPIGSFCTGASPGCYNIRSNVCCAVTGLSSGSVQINAGYMTQVFSIGYVGGGFANGGCAINVASGISSKCYANALFTGAIWYYIGRRSLLADNATCDGQKEANSVFYTEENGKGHWVLVTPNVTQAYNEMQTLPESEKANWHKSHGAFYS